MALIFSCAVLRLLPGAGSTAYTAMEESTIRAYEKVAPSVVNITTMQCDPEFFWCATPVQSGSGSGVVLREDGLIVTNNHVVANAQQISVTLSDGRRLEARVLAAAVNEDFAVLKVDPGQRPLRAIQFGDSDSLKVGERVLAVGNPFGLADTYRRTVQHDEPDDKGRRKNLRNLIQTERADKSGNSAGLR